MRGLLDLTQLIQLRWCGFFKLKQVRQAQNGVDGRTQYLRHASKVLAMRLVQLAYLVQRVGQLGSAFSHLVFDVELLFSHPQMVLDFGQHDG